MKILYVSRLFSGLESSFLKGNWEPTGVPTIFKMIEYLDKNFEVNFLFTVKDSGKDFSSNWKLKIDKEINIKGLKNKIKILTGIQYFSFLKIGRLNILLREIRHFINIYIKILSYKPNIIYIDNSNIFSAAILSKIFKQKTIVLRIMGVYPYMKSIINSKKIKDRLNRYAYSSKFTIVICTQDGSGITKWCLEAINKNSDVKILLNGINKKINFNIQNPQIANIPERKFKVLFIGKLEEYKGIKEFVNAMIILHNKFPNAFHGVIIGNGNEKKWLEEIINNNGMINSFTVINNISHDQIYHVHKKTDVFVSLNKYGNLSNVNLEAIYYGSAIIIPESDKLTEVDLETDKIIDTDSVIRIKKNNIAKNLSDTLITLYSNPKKIENMKYNLNILSEKIINSWDQRILNELDIIKKKYAKIP